jgi:hypothetical protein
VSGDGAGRLLARALVAGIAALCAAALALGAADGAPQQGCAVGGRGDLAADPGLAATARGGPALPPVAALCFRGPRGEPVDFPAAPHHCAPGVGARVAQSQ